MTTNTFRPTLTSYQRAGGVNYDEKGYPHGLKWDTCWEIRVDVGPDKDKALALIKHIKGKTHE